METPIPYTEVAGRKWVTIDGIRMLQKAFGLPDIKRPVEFLGNLKGWQEYMREIRQETFRACPPAFLAEYDNESD